MSPVLTRHAPESVRRLRDVAIPVAAIVLFALLFAVLLRLVETPETVEQISVQNRTTADLEIGVTDGSGDGRLPLAAIDADSTTRIEEVLDQGSDWVFVVTRAGEEIGTVERSRDQLADDGWMVVVPASWDERVAEARPEGEPPR